MNPAQDIYLVLFASCVLIAAAICDLRYRKVPNVYTFPTMLIALVYFGATRGLSGLLFSAEGMALGMGILILPYLMGGMGAGDVKLLGAAGAVVGPLGVLNVFVFTAFLGGLYAVVVLLCRYRYTRDFIARLLTMLKISVFAGQFVYIPASGEERKPKVRYGIAIALGALSYLSLEFIRL
jgi:prepilin peptidase CpaA